VHLAYTAMVGIGTALVALVAWVGWRWRRSRRGGSPWWQSRRMLAAIAAAGPSATLAMEMGWVTTEVGRQPWIVHGILRTEDAVTDAGYIWITYWSLFAVYTAMTVGVFLVLRSMSRRWAQGESLQVPYGPVPADRIREP